MEDDDEFGDLYTDVISSFPSSSSTPPLGVPSSLHPPINIIPSNNIINPPPPPLVPCSKPVIETPPVLIPGLHHTPPPPPPTATTAQEDGGGGGGDAGGGGGGGGWGSEEDSDSEDDLRIVLNDESTEPNGVGVGGGGGGGGMMIGGEDEDDDDDDEDGVSLVIVGDEDVAGGGENQEGQEWAGEDGGEGKEGGGEGVAKGPASNGGVGKGGYIGGGGAAAGGGGNFGYHHPFHSQFKYVRPGAGPLPGGPSVGPGGAPGQVRPPVNMNAMAGRGRGDWRPPGMKGPAMQKGFHPGFWGSNAPGRGLEFTLPSHKNIFDVDIDSFEEKPWKYPGIDVSDFFNFNLNEDSWKDYCKQLEQLRLESTMQSKIRVYESGRAEQDYDPDLPPELVAAAGNHDSAAENVDITTADGALGDQTKASGRVRPPLPTGRAIQVETGYGERFPSIDTRPQRMRDSDSVIEIVLQDSVDDESPGNGAPENLDDDSTREDDHVDVVDEDVPQDGNESLDKYPRRHDVEENVSPKRSPRIDSPNENIHDEERSRVSPRRALSNGSGGHISTEDVDSPYEERWNDERAPERSPHSGDSALDRRSLDYNREDSTESIEQKLSPERFSPAPVEDDGEAEGEAAADNNVPADRKHDRGKDDENVVASTNSSKEKHRLHSMKQQKVSSRAEPSGSKEADDGGDFKVSRSSDNSKATGSSRDHQKWREGIDEEVVQNGRSSYPGDIKRHRGESGHESRRKERDGRIEMERNHVVAKGREEYYPHRDWDPYAANHLHLKSEGADRRKEKDYSEASWQRRDEDPHGRRIRAEDARKQDRPDEMISRHKGKVREIDRNDKDDHLHSRKLVDNGSWRTYHDKDVGLRYREKDDGLKNRHEILDDHHSKRRKDDEHMRRDHVEKEDIMLAHRESSSTRRKRERDGSVNHRKRDDQSRVRDNNDDHHLVRLKDEVWVQRERAEQQRDRDEWYRAKQSYEESLSRREREDGRVPIRGSRNVEEKIWVGHSRGREEYKVHDKDTGRHIEQLKRRERVEDDASLQHRGSEDIYARGNQFATEGRRSRQEKPSTRNDRAVNASDNHRLHEKKHKDNLKRTRETEGHMSGPSRRHQADKGIANEMAYVKGMSKQAMAEHDSSLQNLTREGRVDFSSDDEQDASKRGRSKLERWTSHKDRDYDVNLKASSSSKTKELSKDHNAGLESSTGVPDESVKSVEVEDGNQSLAGGKEGGLSEGNDVDAKSTDYRRIDTVERLKRRSERFKLPLTSEKEPVVVKKIETEPLPSPQKETPADPEVKQERPPRKRRWINS